MQFEAGMAVRKAELAFSHPHIHGRWGVRVNAKFTCDKIQTHAFCFSQCDQHQHHLLNNIPLLFTYKQASDQYLVCNNNSTV